jgi:hypothetical protein
VGRYNLYSTIISQIGIKLDVGAKTKKNQPIQKKTNLFFLIREMARVKRRRMRMTEIRVGYSNRDLET